MYVSSLDDDLPISLRASSIAPISFTSPPALATYSPAFFKLLASDLLSAFSKILSPTLAPFLIPLPAYDNRAELKGFHSVFATFPTSPKVFSPAFAAVIPLAVSPTLSAVLTSFKPLDPFAISAMLSAALTALPAVLVTLTGLCLLL